VVCFTLWLAKKIWLEKQTDVFIVVSSKQCDDGFHSSIEEDNREPIKMLLVVCLLPMLLIEF
jgi:hypothetical protein